jgi:hypothetical protein
VGARSFYDSVATFPPYNSHLIHDLGAFLAGLGAALLAGMRVTRAITVALVANAVAAVLHEISHVVDRDLGGKSSDPVTLGVVAVVFVAVAVYAVREDKHT